MMVYIDHQVKMETGDMETPTYQGSLINMASEIVAAYVSRNSVQPAELPGLISTVHQSLKTANQPLATIDETVELKPAVPVKKSVQPDHIVCLEDGKKLKMLKRYIANTYNMIPNEYRTKWGLPSDYPMTAPNYAKTRSDLAKKIGLGKPRTQT